MTSTTDRDGIPLYLWEATRDVVNEGGIVTREEACMLLRAFEYAQVSGGGSDFWIDPTPVVKVAIDGLSRRGMLTYRSRRSTLQWSDGRRPREIRFWITEKGIITAKLLGFSERG